MQKKLNDDVILTHYGEKYFDVYGAVVPPIFMNSLHVFESVEAYSAASGGDSPGFFYGRDGRGNPTVEILEKKISMLERGGKALMFSSGMASLTTAIMTVCKTGSHIIALNNLYGPLKAFIDNFCVAKFNMSVTYVKGVDLAEFEAAIKSNTAIIMLESPSSFVFSLVNLRGVAELAKKHGIKTLIDNTLCTPIYQKPLEMGIDFVMHTASKYLGGHSDIIGGALVSKDAELMTAISKSSRAWFGGIIGPMEGWLVLRGLRTLTARLAAHSKTALRVARYLEKHPKVKKVYYPGLESHPQYELMNNQQTGNTGLMSLELDADEVTTRKFINNLRLFLIGCSWGGHESLAIMPLIDLPELDYRLIGAGRNLVRLHCGLEGSDALLADLEQALNAI